MPKKNNPRTTANNPLDPVRERYAGQRAMGLSQRAAFRNAKPNSSKMTDASIDVCASRFESDPEVKRRIAEITADMLKSSDAFLTKSQLAELISDEIREAHKEPGMLSAANGLVTTYCKMFGFFEPEKTELKLGCLDEAQKNTKIAKLLKLNRP